MKVALLTIWHIGNYGAELQTYCTAKIIKELGHDVKVIDYRLSDSEIIHLNPLRRCVWFFLQKFTLSYLKKELFWRRYIPKTRYYKTKYSLIKNPPCADLLLVGSDQVWNPQITQENADLFFLNFGYKQIKRASYASSFGVAEWKGSHELTKLAEEKLKTFVGVSCREASGVKILSETFGIKAINVLDPTLLLCNYKDIIGLPKHRSTLAYYPLKTNLETASYCKKLCEKLNLKFVKANLSINLGKYIEWDKTSIKSWLKTIVEATIVVTSSFHGVAVSIVSHRQFVVIVTEPEILERSSRIIDLLKLLGLEDRFFTDYAKLDESKIWEKQINYTDVENKLSSLRDESITYLKGILK